ncbi:MAG TPA: DEAD/DEAH box helicase [Clostridiales bacterium]|nr:DEAD/DEAH box helicase [Clostridiales bacterium]HQP69330.1 DEAD/DEAH box helicase [Clostridiales bacterium]
MRKIINLPGQNLTAKLNAFPYQYEAFEAMKNLPYAAIFHEQGLGKTKIAIDLLLYWLEFLEIDTVLIVTKKQLVENWRGEFEIHTNITPRILTSKRTENYYVFNSATRVIITNFETISGELVRFKLFLKTRNVAIIIDESTKLKNPDSRLTQDFFEISSLFKIRVIMTGTPVANRPYDIWAQIYFLDNGKSLGTNFSEFKSTTNLTNDLSNNKVKRDVFESSVSNIFTRIKDFTVRETKSSGIITLPNKVYYDVFVDFEKTQYMMYDKVRTEMQLLLQRDDVAILDESSDSIKRLLRLVQITSNPRLLDDLYCCFSGKEAKLDELIKEIINRDEKIIVWSIFIDNVDHFCKKYKYLNAVKITGKMKIEERIHSVREFKNGDAKVLFATPQSAKEGLTLTVANNVIFYDRGFNLDDYLQAQDRIHRISQTKTCNIYNLMVKDSIDIWIDLLLKAKQNAAFLAQGDYVLKKYQNVADYSFGELVKDILNENSESET